MKKLLFLLVVLALVAPVNARPVNKSLRGVYVGTFNVLYPRQTYSMAAQVRNVSGGFVIGYVAGSGRTKIWGWRRFNGDFTYESRTFYAGGLLAYSSGYWYNSRSGIIAQDAGQALGADFYETIVLRQLSYFRFTLRTYNQNGGGTMYWLTRVR